MNFFKKVDPKEAARQAKRETRKEVRVRVCCVAKSANCARTHGSKVLTDSY
jgi:hypothetical protein